MTRNQLLLGAIAVLILAIAGYRITQWSQQGTGQAEYAYWCEDGHLHTNQEIEAAGWQVHPQGTSDSVVVCIEEDCDKKTFPATECPCGTKYLLHRIPDGKCPHCNEEASKRAEQAGVSLMPESLPQGRNQCPAADGDRCKRPCNHSLTQEEYKKAMEDN